MGRTREPALSSSISDESEVNGELSTASGELSKDSGDPKLFSVPVVDNSISCCEVG